MRLSDCNVLLLTRYKLEYQSPTPRERGVYSSALGRFHMGEYLWNIASLYCSLAIASRDGRKWRGPYPIMLFPRDSTSLITKGSQVFDSVIPTLGILSKTDRLVEFVFGFLHSPLKLLDNSYVLASFSNG